MTSWSTLDNILMAKAPSNDPNRVQHKPKTRPRSLQDTSTDSQFEPNVLQRGKNVSIVTPRPPN